MIEIYGKHGCKWCDAATELLESKGIEYKKYTLLEDISVEEFREKFPGVSTVPYIIKDGNVIGGFQALKENLEMGE